MLPGAAHYESPRYTGVQHALLAPVSGTFVAEAALEFQKPLKQGAKLATIYGIYGEPLAGMHAPG
ncbi:succinylglutamate desuccinylase, partial [Lacticaseibacillus rhamnosus]